MFWNGTAKSATHRVNFKSAPSPNSGLRIRVRPKLSAVSIMADHPPSMPPISHINAITPPMANNANCITSVHITVRIPPIRVHPMANKPITTMQAHNGIPVTTFNGIAATSTRTLCARILPIVKKIVARVFTLKPSLNPIKSYGL